MAWLRLPLVLLLLFQVAAHLTPRLLALNHAAGSSSAVAVPAPAALPRSEGAASTPIGMGASYGSFKATQNIGAFSGSLSRSLVRYRMSTPPPRALAP